MHAPTGRPQDMPLGKIKGLGGKLGAKLSDGLGAATAGDVVAAGYVALERLLDQAHARCGGRGLGELGVCRARCARCSHCVCALHAVPHALHAWATWGAGRAPRLSMRMGRTLRIRRSWVLDTCQGVDNEPVTPKDKPKSINRCVQGGSVGDGRGG